MKAAIAILLLVAATNWISWLWQPGPVHLSCQGKTFIRDKEGLHESPDTLHVEIGDDTVAVEGFYAQFKIKNNGPDGVFFSEQNEANSGQINRYTGTISVAVVLPEAGVQKFDGLCHRATALW